MSSYMDARQSTASSLLRCWVCVLSLLLICYCYSLIAVCAVFSAIADVYSLVAIEAK